MSDTTPEPIKATIVRLEGESQPTIRLAEKRAFPFRSWPRNPSRHPLRPLRHHERGPGAAVIGYSR
jgi:hypothetical protein